MLTVSAQFKDQLDNLMTTLDKSTSLYVRCIKPNETKSPGEFDSAMVVMQLRCAGMLEAIRIREAGFPIRRKFSAFVEHYRNLFNQHMVRIEAGVDKKELCSQLINVMVKKGVIPGDKGSLPQIGKTKIFLKEKTKTLIDELLEKSTEAFVIIIQKNVRMWLARKHY